MRLPPRRRIGVLATAALSWRAPRTPHDVAVARGQRLITFIPAPNSDSVITIVGWCRRVLPQFPQILQTTFKVTTPVGGFGLPATVSSTAPAVQCGGDAHAPTGFTFRRGHRACRVARRPRRHRLGQTAEVRSLSLPVPGSTGHVSVAGVTWWASAALSSTARPITVAPVPPLAGTGSTRHCAGDHGTGLGGPPVCMTPARSTTRTIFGGASALPGHGSTEFVVTAAGLHFHALRWIDRGQDLGIYYPASDGITEPVGVSADAGGAAQS